MIGAVETVAVLAAQLRRFKAKNVVLDPVLVASGGHSLGGDQLVGPIREKLFPLVRLVTPNLMESALLADDRMPEGPGDMRSIALKLHAMGAHAVLVKGGHLPDGAAYDLLYDGAEFTEFSAPRISTRNTHGTGCALSSAIAARLGQGAEPQTGGRRRQGLAQRRAGGGAGFRDRRRARAAAAFLRLCGAATSH